MDTKAYWDAIYRDKSPWEVSWYQREPVLSLQLIRSAGIGYDSPIIDIGGGTSILVDRLNGEGYTQLSVLDVSGRALDFAKARLGDKAKNVAWYEADVTTFKPPRDFELWHDRAVFHFLTEKKDRCAYLKVLNQALSRGAHLIIAAFAIGGPSKCSGLDVIQYDSDSLVEELGDEFQLLEEYDETHVTPAKREQKFSYYHLIRGSGRS